MRRKTLRLLIIALIALVAVSIIGVAGVFWRLSQAPISLAFLRQSMEQAVNNQLEGLTIELGEPVMELDSETRIPHVRSRNLVLKDRDGTVLANAPKAGVALDGTQLMLGKVVVTSLELIGPRINARRNLDGGVQLGIGQGAASADQEIVVDEKDLAPESASEQPQKSDNADQASPQTGGGRLLELLGARGSGGALSRLEDIKITRASIRFFDEANDANWFAPRADLTFRRTPYGFVVVAKADVASGGDPWHVEVSSSFKSENGTFAITATVKDLVPANVADQIYALAQFAKLKMPFSGHFEAEMTVDGKLNRANGELFAAAGEINLPDYLANPILVDEGALRVSYVSSEDVVKILDSSILVGGSRAELTGVIQPRRAEAGKLTSLGIALLAKNINVDTQGTVRDPVAVDRIEFKGEASMEDPRVEIEDLVVMAGNTGVRLRGVITGGEESAGIQVAGRLRDVSAELLKKLWPPIMTPRTRAWITENVIDGRISEGTFQVNFPPNVLAQSLRERRLPDNVVDVSFSATDVTTRYFKNLPVLTKAAGSARLKDSNFVLDITAGEASLADGRSLRLASGRFAANDLLAVEVPGTFTFDIQGPVENMLAFAAEPDLKLAPADLTSAPKLKGNARAIVDLALPLIKDVPRTRVQIGTKLSISDANLAGAMPGIDITGGNLAVDMTPTEIVVSGPAKLNGVASKLRWQKPRGEGPATAQIETVVDAKMREKLGLRLDEYMSGEVPVKVSVTEEGKASRTTLVEANLNDVSMKLSAAGWSRPKTKGTRATFVLKDKGDGTRSVENLKLDGPGLRLRGGLELGKASVIRSISLSEIRLNEDDVFTAKLVPGDGVMNLDVTGSSIDARPYIKNIISPAKSPEPGTEPPKGQNFNVNARFDNVIAHRGESIRDVSANFVTRRGTITSADIQGTYVNGQPIKIKVTPTPEGRELRVTSSDGGSTLRATNFYSKIAGGELNFYALVANVPGAPIRNGQLQIKRFEVRNEAALAELDERGRPKKSGPRKGGVSFKKLTLPFSTDAKFVRMCGVILDGSDFGGAAEGLIRKSDGAIDITGTMVPAQSINGLLDDVPLIGQILTGGKGGGIFAVTFAMGGTISAPKTQVNPLSAFAPGFLREIFEYKGTCKSQRKQQADSFNN